MSKKFLYVIMLLTLAAPTGSKAGDKVGDDCTDITFRASGTYSAIFGFTSCHPYNEENEFELKEGESTTRSVHTPSKLKFKVAPGEAGKWDKQTSVAPVPKGDRLEYNCKGTKKSPKCSLN